MIDKVVLMHGKDATPEDKWYPWLAGEVEKLGIDFEAPILPEPVDPHIEEWELCLDKLRPTEKSVLIGHSRGGVAILRWLEDQPESLRVQKVILVAANSGLLSKMAIPSESNYGFYTQKGYNFQEIRRHCSDFVALHSKDDQWVPYEAGEQNAKGLGARFISFNDRGHFGSATSEIPELLAEIKKLV